MPMLKSGLWLNKNKNHKKYCCYYYYLPLVASVTAAAAAGKSPISSTTNRFLQVSSALVFHPINNNNNNNNKIKSNTLLLSPINYQNNHNNNSFNTMSTINSYLPFSGIVPKEETNAIQFIKNHPEYDGRGITIGIMDTGIDPGAIGLQQTTTGERKLMDTIDCSGSGDVLLSEPVTATWVQHESNTTTETSHSGYWEVKGLTGRTLKLNPQWNIQPFPTTSSSSSTTTTTNNLTTDSSSKEDTSTDDTPKKKVAQVRLGIKSAYELFPKRLISRVQYHRKLQFEEKQRYHAYLIRKELNDLLLSNNKTTTSFTMEQIKKKEDLEARLEFLEPTSSDSSSSTTNNNDPQQPYNDPGPIYDCIVFYDGNDYRAAIDVQEDGDLTAAHAMADYHKFHDVAQFSTLDMYNYAVNIYDEATTLSIVCDASPHGSHVAGIASAYHPNDTNNNNNNEDSSSINTNGVAPGANLVSLKIGDTRLGSMETGTSLVRGLREAIRLKCDVINLSYGEAAALANSGRFNDLATEAVQRYGIIFVTSAGNNGPALTTTGAPGGTCSSVLSIGAYVSPAMMEAGYSMHNPKWATTAAAAAAMPSSASTSKDEEESKQSNAVITDVQQFGDSSGIDIGSSSVIQDSLTGSTYTWSSVGPASDGAQGVDVCAPGGAITCVPNWTLQKKQLMNGTSMSSPHAAGCVALLLSACKKHGIPCNPNRIRRALQNTAKKMDSLSNLQQGHGMIQVDKAWEYLLAHKDDPYEDVNFETCIDNQPGKPRGIYLRQPEEVAAKQVFSINVNPKFGNSDDIDLETQKRRVEFEMNVSVETTAPEWIKVPDLLVLMYNGRSFKIEVDPTKLPPGLHTAHVHGYDVSSKGGGAIFSVPVTVLIPLKQSNNINLGKLKFKSSEVKRFFLDVPSGATWMDVSIRDARSQTEDKDASPRLVVLHCLQLLPHSPYRDNEKERMLNLLPGQMSVTSVPVHGGVLCELAIARYWSAVGSTLLEVDVDFRGVSPVKKQLQMYSGGGGVSVRVESALKDENVSPSASLSKWLTPLRPKVAGLISALGERDVWPTGKKKIYQLLLTYEFDQSEAGSFVPRIPSLQEYLYESAYESQLVMIYDSNKKLIGVTDAFRQEEVKASKGKITLRLQVRHDQPDMLSKLKDQVIWIERKMSKDISLSTYESHEAMVTRSKTFAKRILRKGTSLTAFIAEPASDKLPKGSKCGDVLIGSVSYESSDGNLPGSGKRPGGYPIRYVIGPPSDTKEDVKAKDPEAPDERSESEKLEDSMLKFKVDYLQKISSDDKEDTKFIELFDAIVKAHPDHIPLLMVMLNHQDQERWRSKRLKRIVEACDEIISKINQSDLISYYGITGYFDKEDGKACKERKAMDEKKDALIEALARKARAVADLEKENDDKKVEDIGTSFEQILVELKKWVDVESNSKYAVLSLEKERRMGRPGLVLKLITKLLEKDGEDTKGGICPLSKSELLDRRAEVLKNLGYAHLSEYDKAWRVLSSPKDFAPF